MIRLGIEVSGNYGWPAAIYLLDRTMSVVEVQTRCLRASAPASLPPPHRGRSATVSGRTAGSHSSEGPRLSPISRTEFVDLAVSLHSRHGKELKRLDGATHRGVRVTSEHLA